MICICCLDRVMPTELFAQIHEQRGRCNSLLEKKNDLIVTLEEEVRDSNDQFRLLITQYRENASVLCSRMETQLQTLESMVAAERRTLEEAYRKERKEQAESKDKDWEETLRDVSWATVRVHPPPCCCSRELPPAVEPDLRGTDGASPPDAGRPRSGAGQVGPPHATFCKRGGG